MPSKKYILGADPGKNGAIALIATGFNRDLIYKDDIILFPTPRTKDNELNIPAIVEFLKQYEGRIVKCYLEEVHALAMTSMGSMFTFGFVTGVLYTLLRLLNYEDKAMEVVQVSPAIWQKSVWKPEHIVYKSEVPRKKKNTKATSANAAKSLFPGVSFIINKRSRIPHDGCIDAALIAFHGLLQYRKGIM